jgi:hypothetical protein
VIERHGETAPLFDLPLVPSVLSVSLPRREPLFFCDGSGFFSGVGFLCFCWGFCGKSVSKRGFLMVNLWWFAWLMWWFRGHVFADEKCDKVLKFIFRCSISGGTRMSPADRRAAWRIVSSRGAGRRMWESPTCPCRLNERSRLRYFASVSVV